MFGRFFDWILAAIALAGLTALGIWTIYGEGLGAQTVENKLERRATELLEEKGYGWAELSFDGQHATLQGQSPGDGAVDGAIEALTEGGVFGGLIFGPITALTDEVVAAPPVAPYVWSVEKTRSGRIILSGYAPDQKSIKALFRDADVMAPGEVENNLQVASGQPDGAWFAVAHRALLEIENLDYGRAVLSDANLDISGVSRSADFRRSIRSTLTSVDSGFAVSSNIRGPGLWTASIEPEGLALEGQVRNEAERNELIDALAVAGPFTVIDKMTIDTHEYANWLGGAKTILPHFAGFRSGEMVFDPTGSGFEVFGQATGSAITFLKADIADYEAFPVRLDLTAIEEDVGEIAGIDFSTDRAAACEAGFKAVLASNMVTFESNSSNIDRASGQTLDKLMTVAAQCEGLILQVAGHTDSAGDRGYNVDLSLRRAQAVRDYMAAGGIAADLLDAVGFGPDVPIADNNTSAGRAANRRIEFKVVEEG